MLYLLEDMWYYSLFTLAMLVTFEVTNYRIFCIFLVIFLHFQATIVKQQLKNMAEIKNMGSRPYMIYAYRGRRWSRISSGTFFINCFFLNFWTSFTKIFAAQ